MRGEPNKRALGAAFAASLALHALALLNPWVTVRPLGMAPPPPPVIEARIVPVVPPKPEPKPPAPPRVLKDTIESPKAEVLEDPIKPQPRRRIADKAVDAPKQPPAPKPPQPTVREPEPSLARADRGLDLTLPPEKRAERLPPQELRETLNRLSEEMLYPAEALQRGLEGEVVILVELGPDGRILDASVASGSGHRLLDDAAVRAVKKLGSLGPSTANKTILLPVRFRIL